MKIAIIGGSGLDDPKILDEKKEKKVDTPYGEPSSYLTVGKIGNLEVVIIARHGKKHTITPSRVNYRANIHALKEEGCTHIIATTAVGSLRRDIERGDLVILDQFIDFTRHRMISFHDSFEPGDAKHTPMAEPFSKKLRESLIENCEKLGFRFHRTGTVVTIEGPRFSTKAESKMFNLWGADVINMSIAPEAILANEAGLEYAAVAMATDFDCLFDDVEPVSWDEILKVFGENVDKVLKLLVGTINSLEDSGKYVRERIRTIPDFPKKGVQFRDITTLMTDSQAMDKVISLMAERYSDVKIDKVCGIEARGFIFGSLLASRLNCGFVPVRKKGKLPGETVGEEYEKEYGVDLVEIHKDAILEGEKIVVVDDLVATGGTILAAIKLVEKIGGNIAGVSYVIDLPDLGGREKIIDYDPHYLVEFLGD